MLVCILKIPHWNLEWYMQCFPLITKNVKINVQNIHWFTTKNAFKVNYIVYTANICNHICHFFKFLLVIFMHGLV